MQRMFVVALVLIAFAISASAQTPWVFANDGSGKYLGQLSNNQFAPDSTGNPFGRYGSQFSPDSINNPFGMYGSPFSPYSATNPFAVQAPVIVAPRMPYIAAPLAPAARLEAARTSAALRLVLANKKAPRATVALLGALS